MEEWKIKAIVTTLKSFGIPVEQVMATVKQFATNGTLEKILKFADGLDELNARLDRLERLLTNERTIETPRGANIVALPGPRSADGGSGDNEGTGELQTVSR